MHNDSHIRFLNKAAVFEGVDPLLLASLANNCQIRSFSPHEVVLQQGGKSEFVYLVIEGTLKVWLPYIVNRVSEINDLRERETNVETLINIVGRGDILGEIHALDGNGHSANVETTEKTTLLQISRTQLLETKFHSPLLADRLNAVVLQRLRSLTERQSWMAAANLEHRIGLLLLMFAKRFAPEKLIDNHAILIPLRLTQVELSGLAAGCRYRTGQCLRKLQKQGLIQQQSCHRISITNPQLLALGCETDKQSV